ncbi:MAG: HAD-IA family hydrolase [Bryobacteraceae bacterium]
MSVQIQCAAILFDMDGTLVDSTAIVERAWGWWAERHHVPLQDVLRFSHGRPTVDSMEHFLPGQDHAAELAEMLLFEEQVTDGITAVPGAVEAMNAVKSGKWAVVTSAPRKLAGIRLAAAGLSVPKVLVGVDEIERGKPDPQGYLMAAERLNIAPADCLVFEDTGPGIEAGLRAGMQAVGLLTTVPPEQLLCEYLVRDFRDVKITARPAGFEVVMYCPTIHHAGTHPSGS